jgi:histone acetyltransferase
VNLDKPQAVEDCITAGACRNGPPAPTSDARDVADEVAEPDLRPPDEPVGSKKDLGPDQPTEPDARPGDPDSSSGDTDASGGDSRTRDVAGPSDLGHDAGSDSREAAEVPSDRGRDRGADLGPDQGDQTDDAGKEDVAKEDVAKDDVAKHDVVKDDVVKDDVVKDDVVKDDVVKEDIPGPEAPPDIGNSDVPNTACPAVNPVSGTNGSGSIIFNTTGPVCLVTCDDILYGWGCDNFSEANRTVKVNGTTVKCGDALPAKKSPGNYYYFEFGAGGHTWDAIHWSGKNNATCPAPAGGFVP